jgi:very-short-patch-repair endonuclease/preprotein translocase subunit YajC
MSVKVEFDFREFSQELAEHINDNCEVIAKQVAKDARASVNVVTGNLKKSIRAKESKFDDGGWIVQATAPHCVFGSRESRVVTKKGRKTIGSIKIGDEVMTQTGEYRKVVSVNKFLATEKPHLVEIKVRHLNGNNGNHTINVTEDHKVMVFRDGRNKWVCAGDLLKSDKMYELKKISPFKSKMLCEYCGKSMHGPRKTAISSSRKYCCMECRNAAWQIKNPHQGMKRSAISRKRMRDAAIKKFKKNPDLHPNRILGKRGAASKIEQEVERWLTSRGVVFEKQFKVDNLYVDFYIPDQNTAIEVDGAYWHQDQQKDIERDCLLVKAIPGLKVVHIHFFDKNRSPKDLVLNPLPNVFYISCNPGTPSFVDPEKTTMQEIVSIKKWQYKKPPGHKGAYLYDLSVDGVHSFFLNGVLVSNSHLVEYGGKNVRRPLTAKVMKGADGKFYGQEVAPMPAKPFLRPALEKNISLAREKFGAR